MRGAKDPTARARMQGLLVASYPNVSVIDLREVLDTIAGIVNNVTLAVTVVGGLVLFSGSLILVGAVSMTKFRRVYEAAILKTLGASSRLIATTLLVEYGVLGAIAGTVGALGAIALSWAVARYALELPWEPSAGAHARRHRRHRRLRGRRRRPGQPRRAAPQAARHAPRGVALARCIRADERGVQLPLGSGMTGRPGGSKQWTWRSTGMR